MTSSAKINTADNVGLVPCSNDKSLRSSNTDAIKHPNHVSYLGDETL